MIRTKKGAVSLYVVIFATLLLGVITLSFVRIMLKERSQSSNDDISQSAYDSALAGIEDAKLAIMKYNKCLSGNYAGENSSDPNDKGEVVDCGKAIQLMQGNIGDDCDIVSKILGRPIKNTTGMNEETTIQESNDTATTTTDEQLDQAYTCVRILESASDYLGQLNQTVKSRLIPLRAAGEFNKIKISWSVDENYGGSGNVKTNELPSVGDQTYFPPTWKSNAPPVIEAQLFQVGGKSTARPDGTFLLTDFDMNSGNTRANRGTAIVVPTKDGNPGLNIGKSDFTLTSDKLTNDPYTTKCEVGNRYHCSVTIELPDPIYGGKRVADTTVDAGSAFLRLAHVYANNQPMDFQILLYLDNELVAFSGVQSVVDSTGRTSDLLRRIESRIELVDVNFSYPEYAVELTGNPSGESLCKAYMITKNNWTSGNKNNINDCN